MPQTVKIYTTPDYFSSYYISLLLILLSIYSNGSSHCNVLIVFTVMVVVTVTIVVMAMVVVTLKVVVKITEVVHCNGSSHSNGSINGYSSYLP